MARIRTIKPEFFTSDDICALSPLARLLYAGQWCEANREGRLVWTLGVLKRRMAYDWGAAWRLWIGRTHDPDEQRGGYRKASAATDPVALDGVSETQWRAAALLAEWRGRTESTSPSREGT